MVISVKGEIEPSQGGMGVELEGTIKGVIFFDPDAGVLVKQAVDVSVEFSGRVMGQTLTAEAEATQDVTLR